MGRLPSNKCKCCTTECRLQIQTQMQKLGEVWSCEPLGMPQQKLQHPKMLPASKHQTRTKTNSSRNFQNTVAPQGSDSTRHSAKYLQHSNTANTFTRTDVSKIAHNFSRQRGEIYSARQVGKAHMFNKYTGPSFGTLLAEVERECH